MAGQFDFSSLYGGAPGLQDVNQMSVVNAFIWYNTHGYLALPAAADAKMLVLPKGYSFDKLKPPTEAELASVREPEHWHPSWRVALIMNAPGGLCAVDVDDIAQWAEFCKQYDLPSTAWQSTGREGGGFHLLYRRGDLDPALLKQGPWSTEYRQIEIKAKGLIIAAPSLHHSGRQYQWQPGPGEPTEIGAAVLKQRADDIRHGCPYRLAGAGIVWDKPTQHGTAETVLTNFTARIAREVVVDDGSGELRREFQIEGSAGGRASTFSVPSARYDGMSWATEHLGANARISPGMGLKDHARFAISALSGTVPAGHVYCHTGWRQLADGSWVFLHAGGAIGVHGPMPGIEVMLGGALARYVLPDPPAGKALAEAVWKSLDLAKLAPARIMVPLLGGAYRAPLGNVTTSVMMIGPTGVRKTAVAGTVQQHFGAGLDALHMASWSSTANALEDLAFLAKDVVLTVDDLAPAGLSRIDADRMYAAAARLLRAQANRSGRQRLRSDTTARPERPPRGMVVATGEEAPRGHSVVARVMLLDVADGDVNLNALSAAQQAGSAGAYAAAEAAYIHWLAGRRDGLGEAVAARTAVLRASAAGSEVHGRLPETVASLMTGWEYFLAFAAETGAITPEQNGQYWRWAWQALGEAAQGQARRLAAAEPAGRFIRTLAEALSAGRAHIASRTGSAPPADPKRWGWRVREFATKEGPDYTWEGRGDCAGWIDDKGMYLQMEVAVAVADRLARDTGDGLGITGSALMKAMHKHGYLASVGTDRGRRELTVRITADGAGRPYVAHVPLSVFDI